jgi:hypothetical protein
MGMLSSGFSYLFLFASGNLAKKMFSWSEDNIFMAGFDFDFFCSEIIITPGRTLDRMKDAKRP